MGRFVTGCVLASVLASCTGHGSVLPSATGPQTTADTATLLGRPLKLPAVQAGSVCPVTPVAGRDIGIGNPRGRGPFYLGGGMPRGAFPWNKTVWKLVDGAPGPVLFRGARVDGTGSLKFSGSPADHSERGVTLSSGGGVTATFYERVIDPGSEAAFYVYPATSGCYAIQVDGATFEDVIVITAA
jgi:hypothetical protein